MEVHTMPQAPPQRVEDMVELVEEILLRLPPDEPASLVRAAVVCKPWCSLISSHRFRRLYRDFHKTPPMLGFFHDRSTRSPGCVSLTPREPLFTSASTKGFSPLDPEGNYVVYDCRHGRVLLQKIRGNYYAEVDDNDCTKFLVWDPMTGSQLPLVTPVPFFGSALAVLCAVGGCDHGACHMGPFFVVYISIDEDEDGDEGAWVYVYSSKTSKWRERGSVFLGTPHYSLSWVFVLGSEALYSLVTVTYPEAAHQVVKYDLGDNSLSVFDIPPMVADCSLPPALVTAEDGGLGLAHLDKFSLHMWSYDDGVAAWTHNRVIDLKKLLPIGDHMISPKVVGSVEGTRTIFVLTDLGVHMIDLSSLTSRNEGHNLQLSQKIYSMVGREVDCIFPYVSFFNRPGISEKDILDILHS
ncbi:hypothetical protein QYE76_039090 [Lolium multiflorum]|uniref:F-box domain-containing protein n=1 Tax=Lolium multiflorum TaxID=4521 RepID=A0AAD8WRH7_LOLMU|nr:hypothetical protein QYE76_039090 [Lolium multiflorum]